MCASLECVLESQCVFVHDFSGFISFFKNVSNVWKIFYSISQRCMVESKDGRSRFIRHTATAVRFSVDAFVFKGMSNQVIKTHLEETFDFSTTVCMQSYRCYLLLYQLFMHCNMSVDSTVATPVAKSCNYDTDKKRSC